MNSQQIQILISARDNASKAVNKIQKKLRKLGTTSRKVGRKMSKAFKGVGGVFKSLGGIVFNFKTAIAGLIGVGGFIGLTKSVLTTGGAFEDYKATLETVLGSQKKANEAFAWIENFAKTTPFEVDNLTASFVKLSAYGIDGTKVMGTLGDTAAAMGKDINQAVEALADAQTGEFERLKEFGIKAVQISKSNAEKMGATMEDVGKTALTYTDKLGKEAFKLIDRNNRKQITSNLLAIWNERYKGAMEKRSKTMNGMLSNLSDAWTTFKDKVAQKIMPKVKEALEGVLGKIDEWGDNGVLTGWAHALAETMGGAIEWLKGLGTAFVGTFEEMGLSFSSYNVDMKEMKENGKKFGETLIKWFDKIKKFLKEDGKKMWEGIKEGGRGFLSIINAIVQAIKYMKDVFKSASSWVTSYNKNRASGRGVIESFGRSVGGSLASQKKDDSWFGANTMSDTPYASNVTNNIYTQNSRYEIDAALNSRGSMSNLVGRRWVNGVMQ